MKTLTVDDQKRIRIPDAKPRTVFAYENHSDGFITLTEVKAEKQRRQIRLVRKNGYTVAEGGPVITQADVRKLLDEFP